MCGGNIQAELDTTFGICDSCGVTSTLPKANDERIVNLFNRANHFRRNHEFDKALSAYESILTEDATNAEAHWCVVLCHYGVEYVEDPKTFERIPTCHRTQFSPILVDADYLAALEYAPDDYTRELYVEAAKRIHEIQKDILAISNQEDPYDIFICYKESTDGGSRTKDSTLAQDIYYHLVNEGMKVFFARITLEDKVGRKYEPYIFNALNTAKVMLVIGTQKEYFEAVWVKNEWSRYLALTKNDRSKLLIPCYRDMDAYDLPEELTYFQAMDMSKIGFIQDLTRGIKKVIGENESKPQAEAPIVTDTTSTTMAAPGVESLIRRGQLFLEDSDWKQADEYFDRVLDIDPEYSPAYIGKLCAELRLHKEEDLVECKMPLTTYNNYKRALSFANWTYKAKLEEYNQSIQDRSTEQERSALEIRYNQLLSTKNFISSENDYYKLANQFREMGGFKDSFALALECEEIYLELKEQREEQEYNIEKQKRRAKEEERFASEQIRKTAETSDKNQRKTILSIIVLIIGLPILFVAWFAILQVVEHGFIGEILPNLSGLELLAFLLLSIIGMIIWLKVMAAIVRRRRGTIIFVVLAVVGLSLLLCAILFAIFVATQHVPALIQLLHDILRSLSYF